MRRTLWRLAAEAAALAAPLAALPLGPAPAGAQTVVEPAAASTTYQITMAARVCDRYTDIFANRARNDIMESLRDLGPDTPYGNSFTAVEPSVEDGKAPQSTCRPLPNWTFSFGTGIGRPVPGTNLSFVTGTSNVAGRQVTTQASTPLLDTLGQPTGQAIAGAVTFTLTPTEAQLASQNSRLWAMGGTPTAPLNGRDQEYGFGALRCAKDNLNGDNVDWIGYPSGQNHVFCYAFYVQPPPTAGRIVVRKEVVPASTAPVPVDFTGNLSFNAGGNFTIRVPAGSGNQTASTEFIRGATRPGDAPWTVTELVPEGLALGDLRCASENDTSSVTYTGSNPNATNGADTANITLGAEDTVTCTFRNDLEPPPAGEGRILKLLVGPDTGVPGGVLPATWDFPYTDPSGASAVLSLPASASNPSADSGVISNLTAGPWVVSEQLPSPTPGWRWEFDGGSCAVRGDGTTLVPITIDEKTGRPTAQVDIPRGGGTTCLFVNRLVPTGGLVIRLTTRGGTGTFGFVVAGAEQSVGAGAIGGNGGIELVQSATTAAADAPVVATGQSTNPLIGTWNITPIRPIDGPGGRWVIDGLPACNVFGAPALNLGPEILKVVPGSLAAPVLTCDYAYRLIPPSTLDLVKTVAGDRAGQSGPVVITASCSDGSRARLEVPPGAATPARLPSALSFLYPVTCQVAETANGVASGASVTAASQVVVNGSPATRDLGALTVGAVTAAEAVEARFTDTYALRPPPTVPPVASTLPPAGAPERTGPATLLALAALVLGSVLVIAARRRA